MTPLENREDRYGAIALSFHWSMALLVIGLAALGLYMVTLPDVGFNTKKVTLVLYHKEFGVLALLLVLTRLSWRVLQVLPRLVENLPDWQKVAARFVHLSFYGLLIILPVTGCLLSSAAGIPVSFFGLFMLPDFVHRDDDLFHLYVAIHKWLGYGLILLICVHAGAALRHHFVFKDDTLRKMLP
ncbi:MAG TPA: cytochrome b [Steroidobacteraceae bacterium]|jgi:cytochrome b561